ncbi:MAG: GFA family protein [Rhodospirillales bacterium]|nr:GFA family protein [Rhodospirillales bacterium]
MKIDGACHCGFITYEAEADPEKTAICHCTDCQTLSGSAFRINVPVPAATFRILSGTPNIYVKTAESGAKRAQAFCPKCGAALYATGAEGTPTIYSIRVGTVRQRDALAPHAQLWTGSRLPWVAALGGLPDATAR